MPVAVLRLSGIYGPGRLLRRQVIEKGERTYPVSEVTIAGHLSDMFASLVPANDLVFRFGTNAPTLRAEGMTVAGH